MFGFERNKNELTVEGLNALVESDSTVKQKFEKLVMGFVGDDDGEFADRYDQELEETQTLEAFQGALRDAGHRVSLADLRKLIAEKYDADDTSEYGAGYRDALDSPMSI